jgi:hypothetical protein
MRGKALKRSKGAASQDAPNDGHGYGTWLDRLSDAELATPFARRASKIWAFWTVPPRPLSDEQLISKYPQYRGTKPRAVPPGHVAPILMMPAPGERSRPYFEDYAVVEMPACDRKIAPGADSDDIA